MENKLPEAKVREIDDLLGRLSRLWTGHAMLKSHGLTATQVFILRFLERCGESKASDLAKIAGLSPGAVTQVCDELVRLNYIVRSRSTEDRRVVLISVSDAGHDVLQEFMRIRSDHLKSVLARLEDSDASDFLRIIRKVVDIVERDHQSHQGGT